MTPTGSCGATSSWRACRPTPLPSPRRSMAQTDVLSVLRERDAFLVSTSRGSWRARAVVVATGQCDVPFVPAVARSRRAGAC